MSKTYKIYTAGAMRNVNGFEQHGWRNSIEDLIRERTDKSVIFVHPPKFYRYGEGLHKTEQEVIEWEISQILDSDIVIVNLSKIKDSIGTHMELGAIAAANRLGKHIYVIGLWDSDTDHPWIDCALFRKEKTLADAVDYIVNYLLL